ncbi:MAG: TatD family nuclease-associated radical SAM protein [Candidatus Bathyarchaeia archaeon]
MSGYNCGGSVVYWLDKKLYLNITNKCTNDCYFCLRKVKPGIAEFNLKLEQDPTADEVVQELSEVLNRKSWSEIVFCGFGEPTMRLDTLLKVAEWVNKTAKKPIRIDTNGHGFLIYPRRDVVGELKESGIDKLSISLNAQDEITYNEICRPAFKNAFEKLLEFTTAARDAGFEVETTAVTVPEVKISEVKKLACDLGVKFRARPYWPFVW